MISRAKAIFGAVLIFTSTMQATNGTRMIGFDARTAGRGGAAIGLFDTPSLMMANPAGIAFLPGRSLDLQFSLLAPRLAFSNGVNNETGKDSYYPLPGLAYVNAGPACDLAWGVGASVKIVPSLAVHAAFEHALNKQQKASTPSILAEEYSGSISQLSENVFHLSLSWSLQ